MLGKRLRATTRRGQSMAGPPFLDQPDSRVAPKEPFLGEPVIIIQAAGRVCWGCRGGLCARGRLPVLLPGCKRRAAVYPDDPDQ